MAYFLYNRHSSAVLLVFLSSIFLPAAVFAQTSTSPCHLLTSAHVPQGFGASWNVFSAAKELLLSAVCGFGGAQITVGSDAGTQYTYELGYEWKNNNWREFTLSGEKSGSWLTGKGTTVLSRTSEEMSEVNYFVAYVCTWRTTEWKCGCADAACSQNLWQLQAFQSAAGAGSGGGASTAGWIGNFPYRVPVTVSTGAYERYDRAVETTISFSGGPPALIHMSEVNSAGNIINGAVPVQFDPSSAGSANGTVTFLVAGKTAAGAERHYHLYYAPPGSSVTPPQAPTPPVTIEENSQDEGQEAYKVTTPSAIYWYQKTAAGFSSLHDKDGNDWLGFRKGGGSAGEYRGVPNMVYQGDGGSFFHPGFTNATSEIIERGPVKIGIRSKGGGKWEASWRIYPAYAVMTVEKKGNSNYWFLYEGTPGGKVDGNTDFVVRSNGQRTPAKTSWTGDIPSPEWVYFEDQPLGRMLYFWHEDDSAVDSYYLMENNMTVFGFGRSGINKHLSRVPDKFIMGMADFTSQSEASAIINSAFQELSVSVKSPQAKQ